MLDAAVAAAGTIFSFPAILFVVLGTILGMTFGAMPGLGGIVVLALLLPLTVGLDANTTMALFGSALGGVAFGGSISAILLNVPGTAPNAATCLDGYPMARKGESGKALGISATASALGALFGVVVLVALIPVAQAIILAFAAPEFFMLTVLGISVIALVTRGQLLNGLAAGGLGILFALVGYDPITGNVRWNLLDVLNVGFMEGYLYNGIKLVPAVIGIFAIAEVMHLTATERESIAGSAAVKAGSGAIDGVREVFNHPWLFLRSAVIGTVIGMIPGVGGTVANFLAYLNATQTSNNPEGFGTGDPRGVIASEAANDAKDGGALLPALAFGIPGSATTALILGALTLHGIAPGPNIITEELDVVFALIISLVIANVLTSLIGISLANHLSKITTIPTSYIVPVVLIISLAGAYVVNESLGDVGVAILLGVLGFFMILYDYSRIALIIGLILGQTMEITFHQSIGAYDAGLLVFVTRPISALFLLALVVTLLYPLVSKRLSQS
jgi:putative tricarboxylic transport membrane protein